MSESTTADLTPEELAASYIEANRIMREAGWRPVKVWSGQGGDVPNEKGEFAFLNLVGGHPPTDPGGCDMKDWRKIQPGHPAHDESTPDTPAEAAAWLVKLRKPVVDYDQEVAAIDRDVDAAFGLAQLPEGEESQGDESNGETGEEAQGAHQSHSSGDEASLAGLVEVDSSEGGPDDYRADLGDEAELLDGGSLAPTDLPIDADFTEGQDLGSELLDVESELSVPELPSPDPEDFAPDEFAHEPEPEPPQDRFIGLDDLDRVRSLRIGDVATEALRLTTLIEQAVSEQEGEFSNIQAYVVSHLDKHTGAFTPQDDASRATYGRFLELSSARSKIALIDARRKDATAFLLRADREQVLSFGVAAAFA